MSNDRKEQIIEKLRSMFDTEDSFKNWLSIPNKSFRNRPPIDILEASNYDYFERFFIDKK